MNSLFRLLPLLLSILFLSPTSGNAKVFLGGMTKSVSEYATLEPKTSEFRAIWIATINNIDWPSKPNLTVDQQKSEFLSLLDKFRQFNMNVVILQVRAASDAFYQSKTEPWSIFLTGKQGRAPQSQFDPLEWAIKMCHSRGMELHAWFNPFRVRNAGFYQLDPKSFASKHPQFVREYDKKYFLDPGYPEVISHVVKVIAEVAAKYDVDAILLDDYFYPYPVEGKKFGDEKSFARYGREYFPKRIKDWRRENINRFVSSVHDTLQTINPKIKFGISPFGIWRNKSVDSDGSDGRKGISSYDDLYADVRKWLKEGWIDFVVPQLYWENGNHFGDFTSLVKWWSENSFGKPLYIGQALYKSTSEKNGWIQPDELTNQINHLRTNEKVSGFAFYSASNLGKLSASQVKSLCDNQLNQTALIHDDRRSAPVTKQVPAKPVQEKISAAKLDEIIQANFLQSLENNPISIRASLPPKTGPILLIKQEQGERLLSWNVETPSPNMRYALVSYKETGKKRYRQTVEGVSNSPEFILTTQKWKELKEMDLLLVCWDVQSKSDRFSNFFQLKRKKTKIIQNPFKHS